MDGEGMSVKCQSRRRLPAPQVVGRGSSSCDSPATADSGASTQLSSCSSHLRPRE